MELKSVGKALICDGEIHLVPPMRSGRCRSVAPACAHVAAVMFWYGPLVWFGNKVYCECGARYTSDVRLGIVDDRSVAVSREKCPECAHHCRIVKWEGDGCLNTTLRLVQDQAS